MSVRLVGPNNYQVNSQARYRRIRDNIADGSALRVYDMQEKASTGVKAGVFLTTLAGVIAAMAFVFKNKKMPFKTPKEFINSLKTIEYNEKHGVEKLIGALAVGSVGGGLVGGALFDKKENMGAKYREAVIQLVGNIAVPLACVAGGLKAFKHFEPKILESLPGLKGKMKAVPKILASAVCLVAGILLGNKVGNSINKNVFQVEEQRKLKLSDMSPHIDDGCLALSLVASESSKVVSRLIPLALMVPGFTTGIAQQSYKQYEIGPED